MPVTRSGVCEVGGIGDEPEGGVVVGRRGDNEESCVDEP